MLLFGVFFLRYDVRSEGEAGDGLFDLTVYGHGGKRAAVIDLKRASSEKQLTTCVEDALRQIDERRYDEPLRTAGYKKILHWGMAFCKKRCKMGVRRADA